ncbi:uncharacterized protein MELLADRAFT_85384 [Melampsora larici-populina 98AG31]|uniref:Uncharacterized protein n=1 Tax=Melampsora larici-populina (strain 98AG31 / pathotype 3-4-7) TaxID=747676 RepID=F4RIH9_MELLP|nr:uncharacterized protein MELLADRAFT_85384 [Melampsora larici-populina 98AG31]EGG07831.1 hypothetical protein MELLADRAFT_85384 [Melampsora larici-populina 98AG31]
MPSYSRYLRSCGAQPPTALAQARRPTGRNLRSNRTVSFENSHSISTSNRGRNAQTSFNPQSPAQNPTTRKRSCRSIPDDDDTPTDVDEDDEVADLLRQLEKHIQHSPDPSNQRTSNRNQRQRIGHTADRDKQATDHVEDQANENDEDEEEVDEEEDEEEEDDEEDDDDDEEQDDDDDPNLF